MAIIRVRFFSNCLMQTVPFMAVLPNDGVFLKDGSPDFLSGKMKTLYLLHGYTGDENDYLVNTRISELSKKYGIAVIMPDGDNSFYIDDTAGKRCFGKYIGEELVEYTRRLFHLSEKREDTFIGGLSMGGYGAMRNGLKYAETFSKILAFSGAYVPVRIVDHGGVPCEDEVSDAAFQIRMFGDLKNLGNTDIDPRYVYRMQKEKGIALPKIFMTEGSEDFLLEENHAMRDFLKEQEADFIYIEDEGTHDWDFWNKHLEEAFIFLNE